MPNIIAVQVILEHKKTKNRAEYRGYFTRELTSNTEFFMDIARSEAVKQYPDYKVFSTTLITTTHAAIPESGDCLDMFCINGEDK